MNKNIKFTFTLTYILLITTGTITFIEALRTDNPTVRHILNIETAVSVIAGYFYSVFLKQIEDSEKDKQEINWKEMVKIRYLDWAITTPLMLLALCLALSSNTTSVFTLPIYLVIVILNYLMLGIGFAGEQNYISMKNSLIAGFVPFFIMFYIIYKKYVKNNTRFNYVFFFFFTCVWAIYGVVHDWEKNKKNIVFNILDLIAKCLIGLGLWLYYIGIFRET
jgi:bacteriorhodopsin